MEASHNKENRVKKRSSNASVGSCSRHAIRHVSLTRRPLTIAANDAEDKRSNARDRSRATLVASANQPARLMIGTRRFSLPGGETPWLVPCPCERPLLTITLVLPRYLEDLQRKLALLKGGEDEVYSPQSMEQEVLRPTEGKASLPDATGRAIQSDPILGGDDLAGEGEPEWGQNLEGASQLTNPLSSGPSTFMAAASGRICKCCPLSPPFPTVRSQG